MIKRAAFALIPLLLVALLGMQSITAPGTALPAVHAQGDDCPAVQTPLHPGHAAPFWTACLTIGEYLQGVSNQNPNGVTDLHGYLAYSSMGNLSDTTVAFWQTQPYEMWGLYLAESVLYGGVGLLLQFDKDPSVLPTQSPDGPTVRDNEFHRWVLRVGDQEFPLAQSEYKRDDAWPKWVGPDIDWTEEVGQQVTVSLRRNRSPQLSTNLQNVTVGAGQQFNLLVPDRVYDPDGDALTWLATTGDASPDWVVDPDEEYFHWSVTGEGTPLPDWLEFDPDTRTFSGVPPNDAGTLTVNVTVDDGLGGADSDSFNITVTADTTAPQLVSMGVVKRDVVLTYDEPLDENSVPALAAFTTLREVGDPRNAPLEIRIEGRTVVISFRDNFLGAAAEVAYEVPTSNPIQDRLGNAAAAFGPRTAPHRRQTADEEDGLYTVEFTLADYAGLSTTTSEDVTLLVWTDENQQGCLAKWATPAWHDSKCYDEPVNQVDYEPIHHDEVVIPNGQSSVMVSRSLVDDNIVERYEPFLVKAQLASAPDGVVLKDCIGHPCVTTSLVRIYSGDTADASIADKTLVVTEGHTVSTAVLLSHLVAFPFDLSFRTLISGTADDDDAHITTAGNISEPHDIGASFAFNIGPAGQPVREGAHPFTIAAATDNELEGIEILPWIFERLPGINRFGQLKNIYPNLYIIDNPPADKAMALMVSAPRDGGLNRVLIDWDAVTDAAYYRVRYHQPLWNDGPDFDQPPAEPADNCSGGRVISIPRWKCVQVTDTEFVAPKLISNASFQVVVEAFNSSDQIVGASTHHIGDTPAVDRVRQVVLTPAIDAIQVDWAWTFGMNGDDPTSYWTVEWLSGNQTWSAERSQTLLMTDASASDGPGVVISGLTAVAHTVRVTAHADGETGMASVEQVATPLVAGVPPEPVTNLVATAVRDDYSLSWEQVGHVDGYVIQWAKTGQDYSTDRQRVITNPSVHQYVIYGLEDGQSYRAQVWSTRGDLRSTAVETTFTVDWGGVPPPFEPVTVRPNNDYGLTVAWEQQTDNANRLPTYAWRVTYTGNGATEMAFVQGESARSVDLTGLEKGAEYSVTVTAYNSAGNTASSPVTGTTYVLPNLRNIHEGKRTVQSPAQYNNQRGDLLVGLEEPLQEPEVDWHEYEEDFTLTALPGTDGIGSVVPHTEGEGHLLVVEYYSETVIPAVPPMTEISLTYTPGDIPLVRSDGQIIGPFTVRTRDSDVPFTVDFGQNHYTVEEDVEGGLLHGSVVIKDDDGNPITVPEDLHLNVISYNNVAVGHPDPDGNHLDGVVAPDDYQRDAPTDFLAFYQNIVIPANESSQDFSIKVFDDDIVEGSETLRLGILPFSCGYDSPFDDDNRIVAGQKQGLLVTEDPYWGAHKRYCHSQPQPERHNHSGLSFAGAVGVTITDETDHTSLALTDAVQATVLGNTDALLASYTVEEGETAYIPWTLTNPMSVKGRFPKQVIDSETTALTNEYRLRFGLETPPYSSSGSLQMQTLTDDTADGVKVVLVKIGRDTGNLSSFVDSPDHLYVKVTITDADAASGGARQGKGPAELPPPAPDGLIAQATWTSITVAWDAVPHVAKYRVEYREAAVSVWTTDSNAITGASHTVSDLTCGTEYKFQVSAYGNGEAHTEEWGQSSTELTRSTLPCNAPPAFSSDTYAFSVAEDTATGVVAGTVSATNPDPDTLLYSITAGNGDGKFAVNGGTGAITVASTLDYETTPSYALTVQAGDGNGGTATATVAITVTDVTEDPDGSRDGAAAIDAASAVNEGLALKGYSLDKANGDAVDYFTFSTTARYELGLGVRGQSINLDATLEDADGNTVIESWPPPGDSTIEWLKTVIEPGAYYIRVEATDDGATDYWVRFGLKTLPPTAPTGLNAGTTTGNSVGISWDAVADAARYKVEYRQDGVTGWTTASDAVSGTSHTVAGLTCGVSYQFQVSAYGDGTAHAAAWGDASTELTHSTAACNVAPVFGKATYGLSIAEDAAVGDAVGSVSATDADADTLTYSITAGNGDGKFAINGGSGAVTVAAGLDYETTASYSLTVQADDGNGGTATATVNITVSDVDENTAPVFGSSTYDFSIAEDAAVGAAVGSVSATDPDNDTLAYAITAGNGDGKFALGGSNGAITVAAALDYETTSSYSLTVQADDGNGGTATATVSVTVTDVNEDPDGSRDGAVSLDANAAAQETQYYRDKSLDRAAGDGVDYYAFTTDARYELGLGVRDQSINLDATLEDANGNEIAVSGPPVDPTKDQTVEWLKHTIDAGTYYIRVQAMADGPTGYYVRFGLETPPTQ